MSARYDALVVDPEGGSGDVKYHLPASGTRVTPAGEIEVTIVPNPSHLEAVNPVVEGWTRAEQTDRSQRAGLHDPTRRAAGPDPRRRRLPGPGRRRGDAEPAEPRGLLDRRHAPPDHEQPGRLHDRPHREPLDALLERPREGIRHPDRPRQRGRPRGGAERRARSRSRIARSSGTTSSIDLVGYRRFGHNEQDEAAYTQPLMVERIQPQPTVREQYAARLVDEGVVDAERAEAIVDEVTATLAAAHDRLRASIAEPPSPPARSRSRPRVPPTRSRPPSRASGCVRSNAQLLAVPEGFTVNPKLARQLDRRREAIGERRDRLGSGRGARLRVAPRGRDPDPADRAGHRAGDVRAPSPGVPRPRDGRDGDSDPAPAGRQRLVRGLQLAALGVRGARLRVRLLRSPRRTRSCSGRRSSATSSTARRS